MIKVQLDGQWMLTEKPKMQKSVRFDMQQEKEDTIPVFVPGSVLSGLLYAGKIPDPYDRDNEYAVRELFWNDYVFARSFWLEAAFLQEKQIDLVCEGLDTLADIYINGCFLAHTQNMHRIYRMSVKEYLHEGENTIQIIFQSVLQYIQNYSYHEKKRILYTPCGAVSGNQLLRKAHSMFGWDWGPQLLDAGIFRSIYLEGYSAAKICEVQIRQKHQKGQVDLIVRTKLSFLEMDAFEKEILEVELIEEEGLQIAFSFFYIQDLLQNRETEKNVSSVSVNVQFVIKHPKLWWPNGYGDQPLYKLRVALKDEWGNRKEEKEKYIGFRRITVSQQADQWGNEFAFQVNGVKLFARGGNYIPEDCIYSRISRERQQYLLQSCVQANFNCIRIWGGGYYPSDDFYDICDRMGLNVWQDLMYACNVYDVTNEFAENCRREVIDNVKRLRHHACLGLWCGNNEIESAWHHWEEFQKESMDLRMDYRKLFEQILPAAVRKADPDTFYWPSSPSSGGGFDHPDEECRGDAHYWDVWHGQKPFQDYQNYYFRFCSEFGFQSFPNKKTVETFTREEDRNIFSKVMESHQKNGDANGKIMFYLSKNFLYPKDFDSLLYVSQVLQGMAIKSGVEHWRRSRGRCMGTLYWQINDIWPAASWSGIDYFGRWKALHYMAKKFYAPVAASLRRQENKIAVFLSNESWETQSYKMIFSIKNMDLQILWETEQCGSVESFTSKCILETDVNSRLSFYDRESLFAEAKIILAAEQVLTEYEVFVPYKHLKLKKHQLETSVEEFDGFYKIELTGKVFTPFVELDFAERDGIFSDNYFAVTAPEPIEIILKKSEIWGRGFSNAAEVKNALLVRSLSDSY